MDDKRSVLNRAGASVVCNASATNPRVTRDFRTVFGYQNVNLSYPRISSRRSEMVFGIFLLSVTVLSAIVCYNLQIIKNSSFLYGFTVSINIEFKRNQSSHRQLYYLERWELIFIYSEILKFDQCRKEYINLEYIYENYPAVLLPQNMDHQLGQDQHQRL